MTLTLHMHRDNILGVCAWVWLSIINIDEWVVSSYFRQDPINDSRFKAKEKKKNINNVCWAKQEGDR